VESEHSMAVYIKKYVEARPNRYKLVVEEVDTFNVCYWYFPEQMKRDKFASE